MSQAQQAFIRRAVGITLMALGVVVILWGAGQRFQGHGVGVVMAVFGVLIVIVGYAIYSQA